MEEEGLEHYINVYFGSTIFNSHTLTSTNRKLVDKGFRKIELIKERERIKANRISLPIVAKDKSILWIGVYF